MTKNSKKKTALVFAAAALAMGMGLALAPHTLLAQQGPAAQLGGPQDCHGPRGRGAHQARTPAERLAHWQEKLSRVSQRLQLNARQNAEAQRILQDTVARVEQLRAGTAERTPERRAAREALLQQADARFSAILSAEQRTAWTAMKAQLRERHGRGHHGDRGRDGGGARGGGFRGQRTEAQRGI